MSPEVRFNKAPSSSASVQGARRLILSVDDQLSVLYVRYKVLSAAGYAVLSANDGVQALQVFRDNPVDLVLLDYRLVGMHGGIVAEAMKELRPHVPIVMVSGTEVPENCLATVNGFIRKGEAPELLLHSIQQLLSPAPQPGPRDRKIA